MKPKLIIITLIALIASACSSSLQMSSRYVDDLYYWPGDMVEQNTEKDRADVATKSDNTKTDLLIISELNKREDGTKTMNNFIYSDDAPEWYGRTQAYNLENLDSVSSTDTVFIEDSEDSKYIINNYYLDDDYSYSSRIKRFHDPYYYNYDFYWGSSWGNYPYGHRRSFAYYDPWFYDPWYSSWGYSSFYYDPWCYNNYNGWYGYDYWYSPYYYGQNYHYPQYWGGSIERPRDYYTSERRSQRPNLQNTGGGVSGGNSQVSRGSIASSTKSISSDNRRSITAGAKNSSIQKSALNNSNITSQVQTEKRRSSRSVGSEVDDKKIIDGSKPTTNTNIGRSNVTDGQNSGVRQSSPGYTPSYNVPRTNTRATYNSNTRTAPSTIQSNIETEAQQSSQVKTVRSYNSEPSYSIPSTSSSSSSTRSSNSVNIEGSSSQNNRSVSTTSTPQRSSTYSPSTTPSPARISNSYVPTTSQSRSSSSSESSSGSYIPTSTQSSSSTYTPSSTPTYTPSSSSSQGSSSYSGGSSSSSDGGSRGYSGGSSSGGSSSSGSRR